MLMKLILLATAAAAVTAATATVAADEADGMPRTMHRKRQPVPEPVSEELTQERAACLNDPTADAYGMDYMYI